MLCNILKFSLLSLLATLSLSCSCLRSTFEQGVCRSSTIYVGTVLARTDNCPGTCDPFEDQRNGKITYIVKVTARFLGAPAEDNIIYVQTLVNSALCGTILNVGARYLFTLGNVRVNRSSCPRESFDVSLCGGAQLWSRVTRPQRRFLSAVRRTNKRVCRTVPPLF
ncbi:unnamed protein product [Chondrus crispus]|uniref:NTR domain-containing protein n=1 Tax=Chondrus crispus TaxID=2769 RepID=R7QAV4_CHOCR|nr:unnamed protein product [Chondrus crispus]CDF34590.1 unnamed protein product [Chondrus crispus]|eukprot:XP_005714409.1 unnamed protein product [Chondrus crispus]